MNIADLSKCNIVESIYSKDGTIDHKHILNLLNEEISQELLDNIEKQGITSEQLDTINIPVCKYMTQITIHGLFPELMVSRLGGYKYIFQNKNKSIGIKYNAIDYKKKKRIAKYIYKNTDWNYHQSSNDFYFFKTSGFAKSKEDLLKCYNGYKEEAAKIDTSLFYGSVNVNVYQSVYGVFVAMQLYINAIYEPNVNTVITNITGKTIQELEVMIEDRRLKKEMEDKKWQEEYDKKRQERIENYKKYSDILKSKYGEPIVIVTPGMYVKATDEGIKLLKVYKGSKQQRFFRYNKSEAFDKLEDCLNYKFNSYREDGVLKTKHPNYYKVEVKEEK